MCEGKCTEPNYFKGIQKECRYSNVHIKGPFSDPKTLVEEAQKLLKRKPEIDTVYCVFDRDTHQTFREALNLINKHNKHQNNISKIIAIISNPCFEIWILLHFIYSTGKKTSKDLITAIRKHFPDYKKNSDHIYQELKNKTHQATLHAKKLASYQGNDHNKNPYTDVYKLINELQKT